MTSPVYGIMKKEIRAREDGGWRRVEWDLPQVPTLREIEVVHGRLIYLNPKVATPSPFPPLRMPHILDESHVSSSWMGGPGAADGCRPGCSQSVIFDGTASLARHVEMYAVAAVF